MISDIKKFFIILKVNALVKPWLRLKLNSILKSSLYRGYNLTCSNLFLPLIPHQRKLSHPRATWHSQIHGNNQPEAKNARCQEEVHSDVCLVSKGRGTTERSVLFQSNRQIRYRLNPRQQQRGRWGSGRPKALSSEMPFSMNAVVLEAARSQSGKRKSMTLYMCRVWISRQIYIFVFGSLGEKTHLKFNSASHVFL